MKPGRVPETIDLRVIGFVRSRASQEEIRNNKKNIISEIVVMKKLVRALLGIESYSHIFVIYFMHEIREEERMQLRKHPRHQKELKKVGAFAVREPARPNPIGLTIVELLGRKGNVLKVKGLDALNGSPVLDIKPYDYMDVTKNIRVPEWWSSIHPSYVSKRKK